MEEKNKRDKQKGEKGGERGKLGLRKSFNNHP